MNFVHILYHANERPDLQAGLEELRGHGHVSIHLGRDMTHIVQFVPNPGEPQHRYPDHIKNRIIPEGQMLDLCGVKDTRVAPTIWERLEDEE